MNDRVQRVTNREAAVCVAHKELFTNQKESLYSKNMPIGYVVFSYGEHWPLCVFIEGVGWIINTDKTSPTTTRHLTQIRPTTPYKEVGVEEMKQLIKCRSYDEWVKERIKAKAAV